MHTGNISTSTWEPEVGDIVEYYDRLYEVWKKHEDTSYDDLNDGPGIFFIYDLKPLDENLLSVGNVNVHELDEPDPRDIAVWRARNG